MLPANVRRVWQSGQSHAAKPAGSIAAAAVPNQVSDWESEIDRELKELGLDAGAVTQKLQWGEPNDDEGGAGGLAAPMGQPGMGPHLGPRRPAKTDAQKNSDKEAELAQAMKVAAFNAVDLDDPIKAMQAVRDADIHLDNSRKGVGKDYEGAIKAKQSADAAVFHVFDYLLLCMKFQRGEIKRLADLKSFEEADKIITWIGTLQGFANELKVKKDECEIENKANDAVKQYALDAKAAAAAGSVTVVPGAAGSAGSGTVVTGVPGAAGSAGSGTVVTGVPGSAAGAAGSGGTPLPVPAPTGDGVPLPLPAAGEDDPLPPPPLPAADEDDPPPPTTTTPEDQAILEKIKKIIKDGDDDFGPRLEGLLGITPEIALEMQDLNKTIADFKSKQDDVIAKAKAARAAHSAFPSADIVDMEDKFTQAFDKIFKDYDIALGDRTELAKKLLGGGDAANDLPGLDMVVQKIRDGIKAIPFQELKDAMPDYETLKNKLELYEKKASFRKALDGFASTQADFLNINNDHTAKIDIPVAEQIALLKSVQGKLDGDALKTQSEESFKRYETASDEWNDGVIEANSDLAFVANLLNPETPVPWKGVFELSDQENDKIDKKSAEWKKRLEEEIQRLENLDGGKLDEKADLFIFEARSAVMCYHKFINDGQGQGDYDEYKRFYSKALAAKSETDLQTIRGCIFSHEKKFIKIFDQIKDMDDIRIELKDPTNETAEARDYINAMIAQLNAAVEAFNDMLKKNADEFDNTRKRVNDLCVRIVFLNYDPAESDPQKATEIYREINSEFVVIKRYSTITRVALREKTKEIKLTLDFDEEYEPRLYEFIGNLFVLVQFPKVSGEVNDTIKTQDSSKWTSDQQQSWSDLKNTIADFSQYQESDLETSVKKFDHDFATEETLLGEMIDAAKSLKTLQESESEKGALERVKGMWSYVTSFVASPTSATDPREAALDHFNKKKESYKEMHETLQEMQLKMKLLLRWIPKDNGYVIKANEILSDEDKKRIVTSKYYEAKIANAEKLFAPAGPGEKVDTEVEEEDVDSSKAAPVVPEAAIKDANTASDQAVADAQKAYESENLGDAQKASERAKAEFDKIKQLYAGADNANTTALKEKWDKAQKLADDTFKAVLASFLETARLSAGRAEIEHDASLVDKAEIEAKNAETAFEEIKKFASTENPSRKKAEEYAKNARKFAVDAKTNAEQAAAQEKVAKEKAEKDAEKAKIDAEKAKTDAEKAATAAAEVVNTAAAKAASDAEKVAADAVTAAEAAAGTKFDTEKASAESVETDRKKLDDEAAQKIEDDKTQKKTAAEAAADLAISTYDGVGSVVAVAAEQAVKDVAAAEAARAAAETAAADAESAAAAAADVTIKATLELEAKVAKVEKEKAEINKKIAEESQKSQQELAKLNKTILEKDKAYNVLLIEKTAADELAAKQKESLDALGVTYPAKNLEAIKQAKEIAVLQAKNVSQEGVIAANITTASGQAARITELFGKLGTETGEHDKLKIQKGVVDTELVDLKTAKLKLEGEKTALESEKAALAGDKLTLESRLAAETSAKAVIQAALNKEKAKLPAKIDKAGKDAVAAYKAAHPVGAVGGVGGGGAAAAAAAIVFPTYFTDLTNSLETFYEANFKDQDADLFILTKKGINDVLDLNLKAHSEDVTFLPLEVQDRLNYLIVFIYWLAHTAENLHSEVDLLKAHSGISDPRYVQKLQAWGQTMQQIAVEQYNTSKKVSEFYGGFYELNAPLAEQNLANMPSL